MVQSSEFHGFSEGQFKFALYWAEHKLLLKKSLTLFIVFIDTVLLIYVVYGLVLYFIIDAPGYNKMMKEMTMNYTNFISWHKHIEPTPLIFSAIEIIPGTSGRYDFIASVENDNDDWMIKLIRFQFKTDTGITPETQDFIYPNQKKYFYSLGVPMENRPSTAELIATEMRWLRASDFEKYSSNRYNFLVEKVRHDSLDTANIAAKVSVNRVYFDITNKSTYDYWTVGFTVVLSRGDKILALSRTSLDDLISYEKRSAQANFFGYYPTGSTISIIPEVNIFDKSVYRPLKIRFQEEDEKVIEIFSKALLEQK